jgi:hypothetical protein
LIALGTDVQRTLMVDAPLSPMRIGRQPAVEDRLPLVRDRSLSSSLRELLAGDPDAVVVYVDGVATTRRELVGSSTRLRTRCAPRCPTGARSVSSAPTRRARLPAWFAVWNTGGAFVPLNPRLPAAERERAIETTGIAAVLDASSGDLRVLTPTEPRRLDGNEAIIQFTSGRPAGPRRCRSGTTRSSGSSTA